jgi:hypothetical protein
MAHNMAMTWFEQLTGFPEKSPEQVRQNITLDGDTLTSRVNGQVMVCGQLEIPTLADLRRRVRSGGQGRGKISLRELVANVQDLHTDVANAGSLFQVASQFNLLEMASPTVTPERGVGIYETDYTQGPACAIAAGAGTIYRNYFVPLNGRIGQSADNQLDCLADLGRALGNTKNRLWRMQNGYALASPAGLDEISKRLRAASARERDELRQLLRIGIQWHTQVTLNRATHKVTQAYCSALPVAYADQPSERWEPFARLVLAAAYEATICSAILNLQNNGQNRLFLTLLGGGAFGNETDWIIDSLKRALQRYEDWNLDVAIVSYGRSHRSVRQLVAGR